jgi:hypothetical protein
LRVYVARGGRGGEGKLLEDEFLIRNGLVAIAVSRLKLACGWWLGQSVGSQKRELMQIK